MKKFAILKKVVLLLSCIFIIFITGCGDKKPPSKREIFSYIEESYGDSYRLISTETKEDTQNRVDVTIYHFESEFGFYFDVEGGRYYHEAVLFPAYYSKYCETDYMEKLQMTIADEINILVDKYSSEQIKITTENTHGFVEVTFEEYSNIKAVNEFAYELCYLYRDNYKFKEEGIDDIDITMYKDDEVVMSCGLSLFNELEKENKLDYLQICYVQDVRLGELVDSTVTEEVLTNIPRRVINKLVINGRQYTSEKYTPMLLYSIDEEEWIMLYGTIAHHNGGLRDYEHLDIITEYLDGDYNIDHKKNIIKYSIDNDSYEICLRLKAGIRGKYYFKKNSKKLNIKLCEAPQYEEYSQYSDYAYIKLSDWANLLNMDYTVDNKEGVVILKSKN